MTSLTDWDQWHRPYDDPDSSLSRRLRVIQELVDEWLTRTAPMQLNIVSVCAGDGRDLLQVLLSRDDADRVRATLLELDPRNVARARRWTAEGMLTNIEVRQGDAGDSGAYIGLVPADLVLLAGVFGNISARDVKATINALPAMCRPGALVVWTRHRGEPDLTGQIREWLNDVDFTEESFTAPDDVLFTVGSHRYTGETRPWTAPARLFTFVR